MVSQSEILSYLKDHPGYHDTSEICEHIELCGRPRVSVTNEIAARCRQLCVKGDVETEVGTGRRNMFRAVVRTNTVPPVASKSDEEGVV